MANRFYTILIVPEKTSRVRRVVVPSWILKGTAVSLALLFLIGIVMLFDYWYVMSQISANKQLKLENRRLRQQVQVFKNKITTIEGTMERVKTFATRLKVITNIEDRGNLLQSLNQKLPDAATNIGTSFSNTSHKTVEPIPHLHVEIPLAENPENILLQKEYQKLNEELSQLNESTLYVEQMLQDLDELLVDQKAFLAALPTRKPAVGYFTSGLGIRSSPYGGRDKMHEGLDIANWPGTPIRAPANGVVVFAGSKIGYGQTIILDHGYGLETWYAHSKKLLVGKGQRIRRGDTIALLGNSGRSTGPHLHYEVRVNGWPVNPTDYILEN